RAALLELRADGSLVFELSAAPQLAAGSVVVSEPSAAAPDGLLRRVTAVSQVGGQLVAVSEQATLPDALANGSLRAEIELGPADVVDAVTHVDGVELDLLADTIGPAALEDGIGVTLDRVIWDEDG